MRLDGFDARIIDLLQRDGRMTNVRLAEAVGLSETACLRRVRRLEAAGVIAGYGARVDPKRIGRDIQAFVQVNIERQSDAVASAFRAAITARPEVVDCYVMTGDLDFLLHVMTPDLDAFAEFTLNALLAMPGVKDVRSSLVLDAIKVNSPIPLGRAPDRGGENRQSTVAPPRVTRQSVAGDGD